MALIERQRLATERAFFPFACLLAMIRNTAFGVKRDRSYSPEDFMPKRSQPKVIKEVRKGPSPEDGYWRFAKAFKDQQSNGSQVNN